MFSINDFFKILSYLKDSTAPSDLDDVLKILSKSEQATAGQYFQNVLDQNAHMSTDYLRLRNYLIDWYASHKTILGTQKKVSDVFSLPSDHIDELIRSFGFTGPLGELTRDNKINFFYDLVNLYKIKGTPQSIVKSLSYFGLTDLDLVEYWLQKNSSGQLVFSPEYCIPKISGSSYARVPSIDFESMISIDPHWMLSKADILNLININKIALPSRSPYFGVIPGISLTDSNLFESILVRTVEDQYATYLATHTLDKTITLTSVNMVVSLLELYLSCIYCFNKYYDRTSGGSHSNRYYCYDGTFTTFENVITLWDNFINYRPTSREDKKIAIDAFYTLFTRPLTENFLTDYSTAGDVLSVINPDLKTSIDNLFGFGKGFETLSLMLKDLTDWMQEAVPTAPNLSALVLGLGSLQYVKDIINFFKPYRARFVLMTTMYIINEPLLDCIIIEDEPNLEAIQETIIDFDTADSAPGFLEGFLSEGVPIQSNPAIGEKRIYNIYVDSTGSLRCVMDDATSVIETQIYSDPPIGCYRVANMYLEDYDASGQIPYGMYNIVRKIFAEYYDTPETVTGIATPIYSRPPSETQFFAIYNLHIDSLDQLVITYEEEQHFLYDWPDIDTTARVYYSRELMDCGSWFDIGASCDFDPDPLREIVHEEHDYYNAHRYNPSDKPYVEDVYSEYIFESGEIIYAGQSGGFINFDVGWIFDSPFNNDFCTITVIDSP